MPAGHRGLPHINAVHLFSLAVAGASYHEYARLYLRPYEIYNQNFRA